jgi:hypothetical protein
MFERIWVEAFDKEGRISMEATEEESIVINRHQAQQLILDLQALVDGRTPDEDASIEGVE